MVQSILAQEASVKGEISEGLSGQGSFVKEVKVDWTLMDLEGEPKEKISVCLQTWGGHPSVSGSLELAMCWGIKTPVWSLLNFVLFDGLQYIPKE